MKMKKIAGELVRMARVLVARETVVFRAGALSVVRDDVYGISCYVNGDPKMRKRDFVGRYLRKVAEFMDAWDRERSIIGTINYKKAQGSLDIAFRWWVGEAIERGERISAKAMDGIDMDDGGDNFGKMWDLEDKARAAGYVLQGGYYVKA